jgi:hypothetical protein
MSAEAEGTSRRRKQSAPRRVVRFDDGDEAEESNVAQGGSSGASLGFPATSLDEEGDAPPQLGQHVQDEGLEDYRDESSSEDGWHVPSLIEGREPRRKKLKTSTGKKLTKAEKKREESIKQGTDHTRQ